MSLAVRFSTGGILLVLKVRLGFGSISDIPVQVFRGRILSTFHYCGPPKSLHGFLKQGWEAVFASLSFPLLPRDQGGEEGYASSSTENSIYQEQAAAG